MTGPSSDKLIEALRKAVSRTSMLAEGNDPDLDSVVRQIRQATAKGIDAQEIQDLLNNAEPLLIKSDEARSSRARQVRETLKELIYLLDKQDNYEVPQSEKKKLESQIRAGWESPAQWPALMKGFLELTEKTLSQATLETGPKKTFLTRIFKRGESQNNVSSDQDIMAQISHTLASLVGNLSLPSKYDDDIVDIKKSLSSNSDLDQLPVLLDEVIHFIMIAIGKTQEGLANYLTQLNKQLASINDSIVTSYKNQKSLSQSRESLDTSLQKQVADTSEAVESANDLDSLKHLINDRMATITSTMSEYRTQMQSQEKLANQSISQLKNKVTRMEKDTTSLRSLLQERLAQAMTDSLTDLPNRTAYQDTMLPLCQIMHKKNQPMCLAVCDIDHFKKVNDTWGHLAGDKVLRLVPRQIRNALTKDDLIFRYGGEEFVIAFPNKSLEKAAQQAEKIRQEVEKTPFNMNGEPVSVSVSIGLAEIRSGEDHEALFARADKQLYLAKESGRNKVMSEK